MRKLLLVRFGSVPTGLIAVLGDALSELLKLDVEIRSGISDPSFAYNSDRHQYSSTKLLSELMNSDFDGFFRVLGITEVDLFVPILTYVFGEAQMSGRAAVVSLHRMHEEFFGLKSNEELLFQRGLKEALHELGHTFGLKHCQDWRCLMHISNTVEEIDIKGGALCKVCEARQSQEFRANEFPPPKSTHT